MEEIKETLNHLLAQTLEIKNETLEIRNETLEIRKEINGVRADLALLRQDVDNIRRWTHSNQNEGIIKKLDAIAHQTV